MSKISTTKEQSKRLIGKGLKIETADMCYNPSDKLVASNYQEMVSAAKGWGKQWHKDPQYLIDMIVPSWSLSRLLKLIPYYEIIKYSEGGNSMSFGILHTEEADEDRDLIDIVVDMVCYLLEKEKM